MNIFFNQEEERGQSLVLVALAMVGLLAFAGLALDGGLAYATRRVAQNAADSGAIAGTYELHRQKWDEQFNASQLEQNRILSKIHEIVESHDVPDTDDIAGNEINDNVRAFYVSRDTGGNSCSNVVNTNYEELCQLDADSPCNPTDVRDRAVGISIEVDVPFQPIFAGFMGWNEIQVSNRATDFDQRTAAVVNAEDTGFNSDLWAIFAMSQATTSGPSTFVQIDPAFQPDSGFAFANVHSQGSVSIGNHFPIMGQVTYCTTGGCSNCFNALLLPEQTQKKIDISNFTEFAQIALERAEAIGQHRVGDVTWGIPIEDGFDENDIENDAWFIEGKLTVDEGYIMPVGNALIYAEDGVEINGILFGFSLTIISGGEIIVNGSVINQRPYRDNNLGALYTNNVAVLWSNAEGGTGISVTGNNVNNLQGFIDSIIVGSVIAQNSTVAIDSNNINTTVRGSVIGNEVWINSSPDTGMQTSIQYNGLYFPVAPDRIELLK